MNSVNACFYNYYADLIYPMTYANAFLGTFVEQLLRTSVSLVLYRRLCLSV